MNRIINFEKQSQQESDKAYDFWTQKIEDQILGKTISFTGMRYNSPSHEWESLTVKVQRVHPNCSGDPFCPSVDVLGEDGESYSIHSESDIAVLV
jgi:hypothetical protein